MQSNISSKIKSLDNIKEISRRIRFLGKKVVLAHGCFDILHLGHIYLFQKASKLGDILIVGVDADSIVRQFKGDSRPINNQGARLQFLAAIKFIDYVFLIDNNGKNISQDFLINLYKSIAPHILVSASVKETEIKRKSKLERCKLLNIKYKDLSEFVYKHSCSSIAKTIGVG